MNMDAEIGDTNSNITTPGKITKENPFRKHGKTGDSDANKAPPMNPVRKLLGIRRLLRFSLLLTYILPGLVFYRLDKFFDIPIVTPKFTLQSASALPVQIDSVPTPTSFNISANAYTITAGWNLSVSVANPSEKRDVLGYSNLVAVLYLGENPLGISVIPGFQQEDAHQNLVNATFAAKPVPVDSLVALSSLRDSDTGSSLGFSVLVFGKVSQKKPGRKPNRNARSLKTVCSLGVEFSQTDGVMNATVSSLGKECKTSVGEGFESPLEWSINLAVAYPVFLFAMKVNKWASQRN